MCDMKLVIRCWLLNSWFLFHHKWNRIKLVSHQELLKLKCQCGQPTPRGLNVRWKQARIFLLGILTSDWSFLKKVVSLKFDFKHNNHNLSQLIFLCLCFFVRFQERKNVKDKSCDPDLQIIWRRSNIKTLWGKQDKLSSTRNVYLFHVTS